MARSRKSPDTTAKTTAARQRSLQSKVDAKTPKREGSEAIGQMGARKYPVPPVPKQHLKKPGSETALDPAPMFDAPHERLI